MRVRCPGASRERHSQQQLNLQNVTPTPCHVRTTSVGPVGYGRRSFHVARRCRRLKAAHYLLNSTRDVSCWPEAFSFTSLYFHTDLPPAPCASDYSAIEDAQKETVVLCFLQLIDSVMQTD